jgi:hypothetical protein
MKKNWPLRSRDIRSIDFWPLCPRKQLRELIALALKFFDQQEG